MEMSGQEREIGGPLPRVSICNWWAGNELLTPESGRLGRSFGAADAVAVAFLAGVALERLLLDWRRQRRARRARRVRSERLAAAEEHALKRRCVRVAARRRKVEAVYLIEAEADAFRWRRERRWQRQVRWERLHERPAGAEGARGRVRGRHRRVKEVRREAVQQVRAVAADQREVMQVLCVLNLNGKRGRGFRENPADDDTNGGSAKVNSNFRELVLKAHSVAN